MSAIRINFSDPTEQKFPAGGDSHGRVGTAGRGHPFASGTLFQGGLHHLWLTIHHQN